MTQTTHGTRRVLYLTLLLALFASMPSAVRAQISFGAVVDLALRNSPRVKMAEADVLKARSVLEQSHDVYVPSLSVGSGLGYTYGFPFGAPSLYNFTSQSLLFDQSQRNYIRAARGGLETANFNLRDVRLQVAEDAANTYIQLDTNLARLDALKQQNSYAERLITIIQQRLEAGQDTRVELTRARLNAAQLRLRQIQIEDDTRAQRDHLARLTGLSYGQLHTDHASIPALPTPNTSLAADGSLPYSVQAAYSAAYSKLQTAFGDSRKLYRPQVAFAFQYSRLASFNNYTEYYRTFNNYNSLQFGLQLNLPIFDATKRAKARESRADAIHAQREADLARDQFLEGRHKIASGVRELTARSEVATLDRELAQDQLDAIQIQLKNGSPNGQPITPKEEQNALVQERQKYLELLDSDLQLRQTQINLLRSNGELEDWLKSSVATSISGPPSKP